MKKKELIKQLFADTCVVACAVSGEAVFLPSDAEIVKDDDGDYQFEDGGGGTAWLTRDEEAAVKVIWFEQKGVAVVGEWKGQFVEHRNEGIMVEDLAHKLTKMSTDERDEFLKRGEPTTCSSIMADVRTECAPNIGGIMPFTFRIQEIMGLKQRNGFTKRISLGEPWHNNGIAIDLSMVPMAFKMSPFISQMVNKSDADFMTEFWDHIAEQEANKFNELYMQNWNRTHDIIMGFSRNAGKGVLTGKWIERMEQDIKADAELFRMAGEDQSQACGGSENLLSGFYPSKQTRIEWLMKLRDNGITEGVLCRFIGGNDVGRIDTFTDLAFDDQGVYKRGTTGRFLCKDEYNLEVSEALYTIIEPEDAEDGGEYAVVCSSGDMKIKAAIYALFKQGGHGIRFTLNGKDSDGLVLCSEPNDSVKGLLESFKSHGGKVYSFKNRVDLNSWLSISNI